MLISWSDFNKSVLPREGRPQCPKDTLVHIVDQKWIRFGTPLESSWGGELHHICFNDDCSYFTNSWNALENQGIEQTGYRCKMDPRGGCGPAPVWSEDALKDLVVEEETDEIIESLLVQHS